MNVSCYLNKEETEFFKEYPKGWLKELVLREMRTAKENAATPEELAEWTEKNAALIARDRREAEEVDALTREHFPDPTIWNRDVFGPRLKR